jgi:L-lactate dehydrogenase complex protein LldE
MRLLRVGDKPLQLLRAVEGLELVELPAADQCCGFGGTFAMKNSATSTAMLEDKMRHIRETGAQRCTAGDASCLMHIDGGLRRAARGRGAAADAPRTVHLAEILASTRAGVFA